MAVCTIRSTPDDDVAQVLTRPLARERLPQGVDER